MDNQQKEEATMEQPTERRKDISTWEKHGQTILAGLILIAITWVGTETQKQSKNAVAIAGELALLSYKIESMQKTITANALNRYTAIDAEKQEELRDEQHKNIGQRVDSLGQRLSVVEGKI